MNKVNARNKWSLSVGCVGRDLCYTLVSLFLLTYLQFTGLFDTTQFLVLSVIIVLCRVWDAVNDPMMGTIISNTRTRFGKYRPWVLIGCVTNIIFLISMFPIIELRGAIPFGVAWGLNEALIYIICIVGNMIPVPFIYLFARKIKYSKFLHFFDKYSNIIANCSILYV